MKEKIQQLLFIELILLLTFIPLWPKFPVISIAKTFVSIRLEDFLIAFSLATLAVFIVISGRLKEVLNNALIRQFSIFFIIGLVSCFSAIYLTHTVVWNLSLLHFLRRVELMMLLPFAYYAISSQKQVKLLVGVLAMVIFLVNIYGFGQQLFGWPVVTTINSDLAQGQILKLTPGARINSTFAGHYDLAIFAAMMSALLTAYFFGIRKIWQKIVTAGIALTSVIVLVMTAARLSFIAAVVGIIAAVWFGASKKFILGILVIGALTLLVPSPLQHRLLSTLTITFTNENKFSGQDSLQQKRSQLNIPTLPTEAWTFLSASNAAKLAPDIVPGEPTDTTQLDVYRSYAIRTNVEWPMAIRALTKNPLLGTGYSSIGLATDNDFLRSLAEVGIFGTLSLSLIIVYIFRKLFAIYNNKNRFDKMITSGVIAMLITFLVNGLFIDVFEASKVASIFWLILGINLSLEKT